MDAAFGSQARVRILRRLARDPKAALTVRGLAAEIGMSPNTAALAVRGLAELGLVERRAFGPSHVVRLSGGRMPEHLRRAFELEGRAWREVERAIVAAVPPGGTCYLFGSSVGGGASARSDVDLLLVAPTLAAARRTANRIQAEAHAVMPVRVSVLALGRREFDRKRGTPLVQNVLRKGRRLAGEALEP